MFALTLLVALAFGLAVAIGLLLGYTAGLRRAQDAIGESGSGRDGVSRAARLAARSPKAAEQR